jgi:hypothetical protein
LIEKVKPAAHLRHALPICKGYSRLHFCYAVNIHVTHANARHDPKPGDGGAEANRGFSQIIAGVSARLAPHSRLKTEITAARRMAPNSD